MLRDCSRTHFELAKQQISFFPFGSSLFSALLHFPCCCCCCCCNYIALVVLALC